MNDSVQTVIASKCPICYGSADSPHHIKPVAAGGSDEPINKVWLCKRCHNIVEMVYDETGMEYCLALAHHIRREFKLGTCNQESHTRLKYVRRATSRKSTFRFRVDPTKRVDFPRTGTCVTCGAKFERTRFSQAECQKCVKGIKNEPGALLAKELEESLAAIQELKGQWNLWQS